jgi:hypothetical protein
MEASMENEPDGRHPMLSAREDCEGVLALAEPMDISRSAEPLRIMSTRPAHTFVAVEHFHNAPFASP